MILHPLWALYFMKAYLKQDARSAAAGGSRGAIDVNTWKKVFGHLYIAWHYLTSMW